MSEEGSYSEEPIELEIASASGLSAEIVYGDDVSKGPAAPQTKSILKQSCQVKNNPPFKLDKKLPARQPISSAPHMAVKREVKSESKQFNAKTFQIREINDLLRRSPECYSLEEFMQTCFSKFDAIHSDWLRRQTSSVLDEA